MDNYYLKKETEDTGVSVTEKTLEKLIKNAPKLKSLILYSSTDFAYEITHEFVFEMLKNENLLIMIDSGDKIDKSINNFMKGKGSIFYNKYNTMRKECWEQWWMKYFTKDPE